MRSQLNIQNAQSEAPYPSSFREVKIGRTLFSVTSVYKGEFPLKDALEDLTVRRVLRDIAAGAANSGISAA